MHLDKAAAVINLLAKKKLFPSWNTRVPLIGLSCLSHRRTSPWSMRTDSRAKNRLNDHLQDHFASVRGRRVHGAVLFPSNVSIVKRSGEQLLRTVQVYQWLDSYHWLHFFNKYFKYLKMKIFQFDYKNQREFEEQHNLKSGTTEVMFSNICTVYKLQNIT